MTEVTIPAELTEQQSHLTNRVAEIEKAIAELVGQKTEAETSLRRISTAVAYLKGEAIPILKEGTVRRPMTAEARQRISDALKASAAKKKAAIAAQTPAAAPEPVPVATTPAPKKTSKKS